MNDDKLDKLSEQLYSRKDKATQTHVPRFMHVAGRKNVENSASQWKFNDESDTAPQAPVQTATITNQTDTMNTRPAKRHYRTVLLTFGILFFVVSVSIASLLLVFGDKEISGNNIVIGIEGPFAVGGGAVVPLSVTVHNQNPVAISGAKLIIEYPKGTEINGTRSRELTVVYHELGDMAQGEAVQVALTPRLFGEENEEKTVKVGIEYFVAGSNATFYKEANPILIKISTSPVTVLLDSVKSITSGQEYTLTLTVASNADTSLENILVQAVYPRGFEFVSADPKPASGRGVWLFDVIEPGKNKTITIKGKLSGEQDAKQVIDVSAGLASAQDKFALASILSTARQEVVIEAPFLDVALLVNDQDLDTVNVSQNDVVYVKVQFTNTLKDTIHDGVIVVTLGGNAYASENITVGQGYFNPQNNTITFDGAENASLQNIPPGVSRSLVFSIWKKGSVTRTPEISIKVSAHGERVSETGVAQELTANDTLTIRFGSSLAAASAIEYAGGSYPPKVGENTDFNVLLTVEGGGNDMTDAVMTATVPQYVTVGSVLPSGVSYRAARRQITWEIGDVARGTHKTVKVPVSFIPSSADVNRAPQIIGTQDVTATDRFTGEILNSTVAPLSTATGEGEGLVVQ